MTDHAEIPAQAEQAIQLDKFISQRDTERWCKRLSADHPAADYWLCHEARILQGFQRDSRYAARFVALDLDRRILVSEASGHPLTHWLCTPVGELEHPFQRSSDLVRLILATLRALAHLHRFGLVHGGLRPDVIVLALNAGGEIDFDSLKLIDFGLAHTSQQRIEKPLFIDLASPDAAYLSPALRESIRRDWQTYAKLIGEHGKTGWYELSESGQRQYDSVQIPDLSINAIDWRSDLFALGHWFKQISLHRIDYYKDIHQEALPALIKKMQKPMLSGGFSSLDACIKAFEALEVDKQHLRVSEAPQTAGVRSMQPTPLRHPERPDAALPGTRLDDEFSPKPLLPGPVAGSSRGRLLGAGVGLILVAVVGAALLSSKDQHASPLPAAGVVPVAELAASTAKPVAAAAVPASPVEAGTDWSTVAIAELQAAAEGGEPAAQTQLGLRYRKGQDVAADNGKAVSWYTRAAEQQYAEAQAYLGFMYMTGRGVRKNDAEAARYSRLAAEQNNATGQYNLGLLYLSGRGVPLDKLEAYRWLEKAADRESGARQRLDLLKQQLSPAQLATLAAP